MTIHSTISDDEPRVPIVRVDPQATQFAGVQKHLDIRIFFGTSEDGKRNGWYFERLCVGSKHGPFLTSEAAYNGFHELMGWERV